ncbi:MAG: competence/damage-inducible protein A, partial [Vicinamibacterales bacterium]|nr:competence/damage-inducible protein A [Vicinamibacterales bacterium]
MRSTVIDTAAIIAVGSELLTPYRADSNSLFLTARLNDLAIEVQGKAIVGDDRKRLALAIERGLKDADLIVMTGGLGPTDDDITRETLATVLDAPLVERQEILSLIRARFAAHNLEMPEINRRQALVPRGAEIISNARGTAPGLWLEWQERVVVALPGPPRELEPMVDGPILKRLEPRVSNLRLRRRVVGVSGRAESQVEEHARPLYARWKDRNPVVRATILG